MATSKKKVVKKSKAETAAAGYMKQASAKAERLHKVRKSIDIIKARHARELESAFKEISDLKAELLSSFKVLGIASVKVRGGASYSITKTHGFQVKSPIHLEGWAKKEGLVRPDMDRVKQVLRKLAKAGKLPSFVAPVDGETISYRSNKPAEKADQDNG